jgi:hypothetical protein
LKVEILLKRERKLQVPFRGFRGRREKWLKRLKRPKRRKRLKARSKGQGARSEGTVRRQILISVS